MISCDNIVKDFLSKLEPNELPLDYISSATIRDIHGSELVLTGIQLKMLLGNHPDYSFVKDARIYINIGKVMKSINLEVDYVYETIERIFANKS